jgi:hypothetical protein
MHDAKVGHPCAGSASNAHALAGLTFADERPWLVSRLGRAGPGG